MEGANKNLSKSDVATLDSLEQQLFAVKSENGLEGLNKASKAGVLLLQNPKLELYAQTKGNPLQFKARVKKQINQLQQQIQQAQLDRSNDANQRGDDQDQDIARPVAAASTPAAAAQVVRQPEDTRIQDADEAYEEAMKIQELAKGSGRDAKVDHQPTRNEYQAANDILDERRNNRSDADKAYEEAMQLQGLAKGPDGKASHEDYQTASDMQDYEAMKNKLVDQSSSSNSNPKAGQPGSSRDKASEDIKKTTAPATKDKPAGETAKKTQVPGGDAVKPKSRIGQAIQGASNLRSAGDQLVKKAGGKLAAAAASAAGLGALAGIADKIGQWATDKLLPFFKKYKFWLMTPTFLVIMLLGSATMGVAGALMQRDGRNGGTTGEYIDPSDSSAVNDIRELLGNSYTLQGQPSEWYYKQNDPEWASSDRGNMSHTLGSHGCVITSWAMIAKYNGIHVNPSNIAPGCNPNNRNCFKNWIARTLQEKKKVNMKWIDVRKDIQGIREVLAKGYPVVAYGRGTFGSKGPHAVVIIGVTEKGVLVLNDPIRSSGHKWPFEANKIDWITALVKK